MTKPWQIHNGPDIPESTGDGAAEAKGAGEVTVIGREGGDGKESATGNNPPSPAEELANTGKAMRQERERRRRQRRRRQRRKKRRKRREEGTERPHGGPRPRSLAWGGAPPH